ncbi:MAG: thiolase family protein [Syntrophaceae bacterium]|jgi:acetyl-CoA acyltransferase|nr:thiolase family protein [Syntrophaceae bacterium]HOC60697.1 thiolase family protein [Smithellaceae bacterium]HQM45722.1 thiolase family protein [Smithellaceae bacterium]
MREAYIVESVRTPGCRRGRGAFAQTRPEDLLKTALDGLMDRAKIDKGEVEDMLVGCAFPEAEQGLNLGRIVAQIAKFPDTTCGAIVNRFCSSGLEAIALQAMRIKSGWCDVAIGAGCESMSIVPMGGNMPRPNPEWAKENADVYMSMGITAENVARRYGITREMQDEFAYHSNMKAAQAQKNKSFTEIIPTPAYKYIEKDGMWTKTMKMQDFDDGVRADTTIEGLGKLRGAFASANPWVPNQGSVTAGNSSQTTDGAAASLIMSEEAVKRLNVKPIARILAYAVAGCKADEMGVGPAYAVPKALQLAGLKVEDINLWELNEAFASQCIYAMQKLGLYDDKSFWSSDSDKRIVNVNGGAIALGHPLGCTGAKLCAQLINQMKIRKAKYGVESMCIGGGMGAAAVFELC